MVDKACSVLHIAQPHNNRRRREVKEEEKVKLRNKLVNLAISDAIEKNPTNVLIRLAHRYKRIAFEAFILLFKDYMNGIIRHISAEFGRSPLNDDANYVIEMIKLVRKFGKRSLLPDLLKILERDTEIIKQRKARKATV
jgi:hypothetical protein